MAFNKWSFIFLNSTFSYEKVKSKVLAFWHVQTDKLKKRMKHTCDYPEKSNIVRELHLTESELIRFRMASPFEPELALHQDNMSLNDFNL